MSNLKTFLKKSAAVFLALLMVTGMSLTVAAKSFDDVDAQYDHKEQIDILSDIGIIVGTSDTEFSPDENVTREQMAMLLFRLMLARDNAGSVNSTAFEDLYDPTYHGVISWANAAGYIIGTSDSTFNPTGGITLQDAMTMLVRALGQSNANMDKGYPWTYIDAAIKLGLDETLNQVGYEDTLTRGETAALLYNALTAEYLIPKTSSNGATLFDRTTIIEYVFGYELDDSTLVATNNYSIDGKAIVVKDGYVTFANEEGKTMTVSFQELGLDGTPNEWLGKQLKLIYKIDSKTKLVSVLGTSYNGRSESFDSVEVGANNAYISVNGVRYNVVETLSDSLSTNENELLVYFYDATGKLTQLKSNAEINEKLGFYDIEMIFDNAESETANRALLKNYTFGRLEMTNGKINIANNLTADALTGGFSNESNAEHGDYVLYYFNNANKQLEIVEKLEAQESALITKLSAGSATLNNVDYKLGNPAAGVPSAGIASQLTVGKTASIIQKDGFILAVPSASAVVTDSQYLVTTSTAVPVYHNGYVRYAVSANINGVNTNIITSTADVSANTVYRYLKDSNDLYTLIPQSSSSFTQNGDFAVTQSIESNTTLSNGVLPYYTLGSINFVTSSKTIIIAKNEQGYQVTTGFFNSAITLNKDAVVTAIFNNNAGNVKTLAYMFISDGSVGKTDSTTQYVKILAKTGSEYINGTVYTLYTGYNFNTGAIGSYKSVYSNLNTNNVYAIGPSSLIIDAAATDNHISGLVTGYTTSTITVDGTTYRLASGVVINRINANNTTTGVTLASIFMHNVEFVVSGGEVKAIIDRSELTFTSKLDGNSIVMTPSVSINGIEEQDIELVKVMLENTEINAEGFKVEKTTSGESTVLTLSPVEEEASLAAGSYLFTVKVNGQNYTAAVTVTASAA